MKTLNNCVTGTLEVYQPSAEKPWDKARVNHLLRRLTYGATPSTITDVLNSTPAVAVDIIIDEAAIQSMPEEPTWAYWTEEDYTDINEQRDQQYRAWTFRWVTDMIENGFREKIELFWSNHFVTQYESYMCPSWMYLYHKVIKEHALGNFKDFVKAIGTTPAMLVYLNGVQNSRIQPNENYARELFELFTLGRDNGYNQMDIEEAARALTGWVGFSTYCGSIGFVGFHHDPGEKTIFGRNGNWNYSTLHDVLFEERGSEIAHFICRKIYTAFVHPTPDEAIISQLAQTFLEADFELVPVFKQLFKSEHFFDEYVIGTQIKSPYDYFIHFIKSSGFSFNEQILEGVVYFSFLLGQYLFNPTDVAGWPGDKAWINNNTLTNRWQGLLFFLFYTYENYPEQLTQLAKDLIGETTDPSEATKIITDHFLSDRLMRQEDYDRATKVFKHEIPQNYFDNNEWNLNWDTVPAQVALLLQHLIQLPEFQLY